MDDKIFDRIHEVDLKETMETSYIDYAMSVIAARALPDVRDGLKPVQRRVLYSMVELNNGPDKPHRKCARIVGDTMGKFHPHGDSSIYGALVNMAQDWSTRYPLVDGHGNFGSEDGDGAAAMRYTEARLSKISMEMVRDINKDTVEFQPNFDETEKEPTVLYSLDKLINVGLVEKKKCITDEKNKKKTQYVLRDYMFKFWYEFIPKATSVIEMGQGEIYYQDTQSGLKHYQKRMYCCLH